MTQWDVILSFWLEILFQAPWLLSWIRAWETWSCIFYFPQVPKAMWHKKKSSGHTKAFNGIQVTSENLITARGGWMEVCNYVLLSQKHVICENLFRLIDTVFHPLFFLLTLHTWLKCEERQGYVTLYLVHVRDLWSAIAPKMGEKPNNCGEEMQFVSFFLLQRCQRVVLWHSNPLISPERKEGNVNSFLFWGQPTLTNSGPEWNNMKNWKDGFL